MCEVTVLLLSSSCCWCTEVVMLRRRVAWFGLVFLGYCMLGVCLIHDAVWLFVTLQLLLLIVCIYAAAAACRLCTWARPW
jgi:hypothetical protein